MDFPAVIFSLLICVFFIINCIISIFSIEKKYKIHKKPTILNEVYETKTVID